MKRLICILTSLFFAVCLMAQPPQGRRTFSPEEYEKNLETFITERAGLNQDEATKFFPLLKEMRNAQRQIGIQQRKMQKPAKESNEEECKRIVENMTNMELKLRQIEQTYYTKKFPKVLSWNKILRVRVALEQFKMEALRMFSPHGRPGNNGQPNGGQGGFRRNERKGPQCE